MSTIKRFLAALSFVLPVALVSHFLFSWIGFNPTDDGVVLAASRRILERQVPHLDFISIRPVGSSLLYLPLVAFAGDSCIWLSRLVVWLEFAIIAWVWTQIGNHLSKHAFGVLERTMLGLIAFAFSAHTFSVMPWTTVDGLCLASIGLFFCIRDPNGFRKILGYVLLGCACLCRQTYIPLIPAALAILGDWRRMRYWFAAIMPCLLYAVYLSYNGAFSDAVIQLSSRSSLLQVGVLRYFKQGLVPWGAIFGYVAIFLVLKCPQIHILHRYGTTLSSRLAGIVSFYLMLSVCGLAIALGKFPAVAFVLFGCVLGCTCRLILKGDGRSESVRVGILAMAVAWCASISLGANTPALAAGVFVPLVAAYCCIGGTNGGANASTPRLRIMFTIGVTAMTILAFAWGRTQFVYRDLPADMLGSPLGQAFAGGNGIRTNGVTYDFLLDLRKAIGKCGAKQHAIIPDLAGYWIRSAQRNPLPIDWANQGELPTKPLVDRVVRDIDERRGRTIVIVGKVRARSLVGTESPCDVPEEDVSAHVRTSWRKIGDTKYFELYE